MRSSDPIRGSLKTMFGWVRGPWLIVDCREKKRDSLNCTRREYLMELLFQEGITMSRTNLRAWKLPLESRIQSCWLHTAISLSPVSAELEVFSGRVSGDGNGEKLMEGWCCDVLSLVQLLLNWVGAGSALKCRKYFIVNYLHDSCQVDQ